MIQLTRLNHVPLVLNSDLIEHIEITPDTVITLTSGQKIMVLEAADDIAARVVAFRHSILRGVLNCPLSKREHPKRNRGPVSMAKPAKPRPLAIQPIVSRPDFATIGGLILALGGIVGGLLLEGGKIKDVAQITAACIVFGGTFGAVMVTTPFRVLLRAAARLNQVFVERVQHPQHAIEEIISFATKARKHGMAAYRSSRTRTTFPIISREKR